MSANFTPDMTGYKGLSPFRFWCQKTLPLVYDDSLSYYELLCKVVSYINNLITDVAAAEENVDKLLTAYNQLQEYVNDYFDGADFQQKIDDSLDRYAEDGTLSRMVNTHVTALLPYEVGQQIGAVVDEDLGPVVDLKLPAVVESKIAAPVATQLPGVVQNQIDAVVGNQIDGAVAGQIDEVVADQITDAVSPLVHDEVTGLIRPAVSAELPAALQVYLPPEVQTQLPGAIGTDLETIAPPVIEDWLDAHPEATTSVPDGSISFIKLATDLQRRAGIVGTYFPADFTNEYAWQVNQYAVYQGSVYRCIKTTTAGQAWNASEWTSANMNSDLFYMWWCLNYLSQSITTIDSSPATSAHEAGEYFIYYDGVHLYRLAKASSNIAVGDTLTANGNFIYSSVANMITDLKVEIADLKSAVSNLNDVVVFKVNVNALNTVVPFIVHNGDAVTIRAKDGSALTVTQLRLVRADRTNDYWSVAGLLSRTITATEEFVGVFVHGGTAQDIIVEKTGSYLDYQPQIDALNSKIAEYGSSSTITPQSLNTGYIHRDGRIMTASNFRYTDPIYIEKGTIKFNALGYSNNVSLLALCDAEGENRITLVTSTPNAGTESVNYRIPYPMYVIISSQQSVPIQYTITKDNSLIPEMISLSLFTHFGVIGDSYASGNIYYGNTYKTDYAHSWGQLIAKKFGTTCTNYSKGGLSTRTWLTDAKGLPLVLSSDPEDVYYLALGINDAWSLGIDYLGSLSDITSHSSYQDYPDTFYGNYGKIIEQIIAHAPHAKLMIFTLAQTGDPNPQFSSAIQEIAEHYKIPCAIELDDVFFTSPLFKDFLIGGHPSGLGYGGMATAMERLIINTVVSNAAYFNDIYGYDD